MHICIKLQPTSALGRRVSVQKERKRGENFKVQQQEGSAPRCRAQLRQAASGCLGWGGRQRGLQGHLVECLSPKFLSTSASVSSVLLLDRRR